MSPAQGRLVFDHVVATGARDVLELGTAHGVGAAYLAAAGDAVRVTTVDFAGASYSPSPEEVLARAGVASRVEVVSEGCRLSFEIARHTNAAARAGRSGRSGHLVVVRVS